MYPTPDGACEYYVSAREIQARAKVMFLRHISDENIPERQRAKGCNLSHVQLGDYLVPPIIPHDILPGEVVEGDLPDEPSSL